MPHNHASNDSVFALSKHQGLCSKHIETHTHIEGAGTTKDVKKLQAKGAESPSSHLNTQCTYT